MAVVRRVFFKTADQTLRAGGYLHSELLAKRTGADFTGIDLITLMRDWASSRQVPLERLTWGRLGPFLMGAAAFFLPVFSFVFQEMAGRGRNPNLVIMGAAFLGSAGLIVGGIMLWTSTSRIRRRVIERANTVCPECSEAVNLATSRCPCGYLESTGRRAVAASETPLTVPPPLPGAVAPPPVAAVPCPALAPVWEVETSGEPMRLTGVAAIRSAILDGRIAGTTKARVPVATVMDAPPPPWSDVQSLAFFSFNLHVLFAPVWAHTMRGLRIGAVAGIAVWLLSAIYNLFVLAENPVAGAVVLLCVWGVANLALPPQIVFFSSRIFWGAMSLTLIISHMNFGGQIWTKGVALGVGAFFGVMSAGALTGGLGGMTVGTIAGYVRHGKLPRAPEAAVEGARPLLTGVLVPVLVLAAVSTVYVVWVLPWLERFIASQR